MNNDYLIDGYHGGAVANAPVSERVTFMRKTYAHLGGAVLAFVALEALAIKAGFGEVLLEKIRGAGSMGWIGIMLLFMGGGWVAQMMAQSRDRSTQYLGLAGYVALEVLFFLPILTLCYKIERFSGVPVQAGIITLSIFGGLTAAVLLSKKDFSFLGYGLQILGWGAFGLVIASMIGGFGLGLWFSFAMVALVCGYILYDTSNVLHHYAPDQYVGAALALFASIAMLFYYVIRILMATRSE